MDEDEHPGRNPQMQPGRLYVPSERHENAHHNRQNQNGGKLVEQNGHARKFSSLLEAERTTARRPGKRQQAIIRVTSVTNLVLGGTSFGIRSVPFWEIVFLTCFATAAILQIC